MLRLFLFATPGGSCFEIGERLAEYYDIPYNTLEYKPEKCKSYFDDKIPAVLLDAGDFTSGSASQQMVRDPKSLEIEKEIIEKDSTIISPDSIRISEEEKFEIFQIEQGIIASQIAEMFLAEWATQIIFLKSDMDKTIEWFSKRRQCLTCGAAYHLDEKPSKHYEICDRCGTQLVTLPQDQPDNMRAQYKEFKRQFWKFKEKSKQYTKFKEIDVDACKDAQEIYRQIDYLVRESIEKTTNWYQEI